MEVRDFLDALWRHKWLILVTTVVSMLVSIIGSFLIRPSYTASALIRVSSAPDPIAGQADVRYVERLMNTYIVMVQSNPVVQSVIQELQLNIKPADLVDMIKSEVIENTELMRVAVTDSNAQRATDISNALVSGLIRLTDTAIAGGQSASQVIRTQMDQIQQELTTLQDEYNRLLTETPTDAAKMTENNRATAVKQATYDTLLQQYDQARLDESMRVNATTLVEPATPPRLPTSPRRTLNTVLGGVLGLLGGVAYVLTLNMIDKRIFTPHQVETIFKLPVIAEIAHTASNEKTFNNMSPDQRETYRRLRVNLLGMQKDMPLRTVLFASAEEGEGKSTILANLAFSFFQMKERVLVIDCDLRRPMQHILFDVKNNIGLSTVLEKRARVTDAIQPTQVRNVKIMPSGPLQDDPAGLLNTPYMRQVLEELKPKFDLILIDSPDLTAVVDAAVIAPLADGVVHVLRCGQSNSDAIHTTLTQMNEVQATSIGLIVNDAPSHQNVVYRLLQSA